MDLNDTVTAALEELEYRAIVEPAISDEEEAEVLDQVITWAQGKQRALLGSGDDNTRAPREFANA